MISGGAVHQPQHPGRRRVEDGVVRFAAADRGADRGVAHPEVGRHLQVESGTGSGY
jgi:hypothetical protein